MHRLIVFGFSLFFVFFNASISSGEEASQNKGARIVEEIEEYLEKVDRVRTVKRTVNKEKVVIVLFDFSISMTNYIEQNKTKVQKLLDQFKTTHNRLRGTKAAKPFMGAAVAFSGCYKSQAAEKDHTLDFLRSNLTIPAAQNNWGSIMELIDPLEIGDQTDITSAVMNAASLLRPDQYAEVFLYSDTKGNCGGDWRELLKKMMELQYAQTFEEKYTVMERRFKVNVIVEAAKQDHVAHLKALAKLTGGAYADSQAKYEKLIKESANAADQVDTIILQQQEQEETQNLSARELEQEEDEIQKAAQRAKLKLEQKARTKRNFNGN